PPRPTIDTLSLHDALPIFPGLLSSAKAERVDGGYKLTGRKAFGSLTPVWTRLGGHAMDTSDPKAPKIVHFFLTRDAKGYTIKETDRKSTRLNSSHVAISYA